MSVAVVFAALALLALVTKNRTYAKQPTKAARRDAACIAQIEWAWLVDVAHKIASATNDLDEGSISEYRENYLRLFNLTEELWGRVLDVDYQTSGPLKP